MAKGAQGTGQEWPYGAKYQNPKKSLDQEWTPKKSHSKFLSLKISREENKFDWTLNAELRGRDTRAEPRIFRLYRQYSPKNPYLYQATNKNPGIEDFKPQKILRSSLSLEIRSNTPREKELILIIARCIEWRKVCGVAKPFARNAQVFQETNRFEIDWNAIV